MLNHFENMFKEVRTFLLSDGKNMLNELGTNPKGDVTKGFDLKSEEIVIEYCKKNNLPVEIVSEESGTIKISDNPKYDLILDPVDGSNNFSKGIEWVAFSIAAVKHGPLILRNVDYALVGSVFTGSIFKAEKGKGAFRDGKKITTSNRNNIKDATLSISFEMKHHNKWKLKRIYPIMEKIKFVRRGGATALDLAYVASGGYEGFIELIDRCTPENFFASYLIIKEAGGVFTDTSGKEFDEMKMSDGYNFIASCNEELHKQILDVVDMDVKE